MSRPAVTPRVRVSYELAPNVRVSGVFDDVAARKLAMVQGARDVTLTIQVFDATSGAPINLNNAYAAFIARDFMNAGVSPEEMRRGHRWLAAIPARVIDSVVIDRREQGEPVPRDPQNENLGGCLEQARRELCA